MAFYLVPCHHRLDEQKVGEGQPNHSTDPVKRCDFDYRSACSVADVLLKVRNLDLYGVFLVFVLKVGEDKLIELSDDLIFQLKIRDAEPLAVVHKDDAIVVFDLLDFSTVVSHLVEVKFFFCFVSNYFSFGVFAFFHEVVAFYSEL